MADDEPTEETEPQLKKPKLELHMDPPSLSPTPSSTPSLLLLEEEEEEELEEEEEVHRRRGLLLDLLELEEEEERELGLELPPAKKLGLELPPAKKRRGELGERRGELGLELPPAKKPLQHASQPMMSDWLQWKSRDVGVQFNYSVPSRDVGVQFNYLMPMSDHLRGVHVVSEKLFQISGEVPQLLEWEEYGLRIQVPKGATSICDIAIKAIVAGQFEFSEGTDLVSAVYAISVSKKLTHPVILEMQHCVAISSEEQGRFLSFVRAKCNQPDLPYKFKLLDGGSFPPRSDYGKISCSHFSLFAIARQHPKQLQPADDMFVTTKKYAEPSKEDLPEEHFPEKQEIAKTVTLSHNRRRSSNNEERSRVERKPNPSTHLPAETGEAAVHHDGSLPPPLEYTACTFYINKERNSWVWHFNVTKKLDALIQQVKKEHKIWENPSYFPFQFCEHELILDLREYNEKGWSILSNMYPCKLQKEVVDNWTHASPVCCHFEVFAVEGPTTASYLKYYLPVKGVTPLTELLIHQRLQTTDPVIQHAAPPKHDKASVPVLLQSPPEIVDFLEQVAVKVSAKWRMLGLKLGVKTHELDEISNQNQDGVLCLERVLASWKDKANPPYTWATVIDALKSPIVGEKSVAEDVEMWLSLKIV